MQEQPPGSAGHPPLPEPLKTPPPTSPMASPIIPADLPAGASRVAADGALLRDLEKANAGRQTIESGHPPPPPGAPKPGDLVQPKATDIAAPQPASVAVPAAPTVTPPVVSAPPAPPAPVPRPAVPPPARSTPAAMPSLIRPPLPQALPSSPPPSLASSLQTPQPQPQPVSKPKSSLPKLRLHLPKFKLAWRKWLDNRGLLFVPLLMVAIIFVLMAVPMSRYHLAGLVIKKDFNFQVTDSMTGQPVSGAQVTVGSVQAITDGDGVATLHGLSAGDHQVVVSRSYYTGAEAKILVPILSQKGRPRLSLLSTGSLINVTAKNLLTGQALAGVELKSAGLVFETSSKGQALLALPPSVSNLSASLSAPGYNTQTANLSLNPAQTTQATLQMTPAGKAYYLAKSPSGINVDSANLDGTGVKILLASSGYEAAVTTKLLTSPDGNYVGLVERRTADPHTEVYIINTQTGKYSEIDFGSDSFTLDGWVGDDLIYAATADDLQSWQAGRQLLKSYDTVAEKGYVLSKSGGFGSAAKAGYQTLASVIARDGRVTYGLNWQMYGAQAGQLSGRSNTLMSCLPDGSDQKTLASYDAASYLISYAQYSPTGIYIKRTSVSGGDSYFNFVLGQAQPSPQNLSPDQFNQAYPKYFDSPSAQLDAWSKTDGSSVVVSQPDGQSPVTVYSAVGVGVYGWSSDNYLLITKNGGLYSLSVAGGTAVKIADAVN